MAALVVGESTFSFEQPATALNGAGISVFRIMDIQGMCLAELFSCKAHGTASKGAGPGALARMHTQVQLHFADTSEAFAAVLHRASPGLAAGMNI